MAITVIDIIQDITAMLENDEPVFLDSNVTVGTVIGDAGYKETDGAGRRRLTIARDERKIALELRCLKKEANGLTLSVLVSERAMHEYTAELKFVPCGDGYKIGDRNLALEKAGLINYIRRYAPQLFDESGEVWFGEFYPVDKTCAAVFWQRFILYAVLHGRAKAQRASGGKKTAFHIKITPEPEPEPSFMEASRGAFLGAMFFLLALAGWFIWLRE